MYLAIVASFVAWSLSDAARLNLAVDTGRKGLCTPLLTRYVCQAQVWAQNRDCVKKLCEWPEGKQQECCDVMGAAPLTEEELAAPVQTEDPEEDLVSEASLVTEPAEEVAHEQTAEDVGTKALTAAWYKAHGNPKEGLPAASVALALCLDACGGGECRPPATSEECGKSMLYIQSENNLKGDMLKLHKYQSAVAPGCSVIVKRKRLTWNPHPDFEAKLPVQAQRAKDRVIACFK